jgi:hypothetical protein
LLNTFISDIESWFTNLLFGFRSKIIPMLMLNLSTIGMWKGIEGASNANSLLKGVGMPIAGMAAGLVGGLLMGTIIDSLLPLSPSTTVTIVPHTSISPLAISPVTASTTYIPSPETVLTPSVTFIPQQAVVNLPTAYPYAQPFEEFITDTFTLTGVNVIVGTVTSSSPTTFAETVTDTFSVYHPGVTSTVPTETVTDTYTYHLAGITQLSGSETVTTTYTTSYVSTQSTTQTETVTDTYTSTT